MTIDDLEDAAAIRAVCRTYRGQFAQGDDARPLTAIESHEVEVDACRLLSGLEASRGRAFAEAVALDVFELLRAARRWGRRTRGPLIPRSS